MITENTVIILGAGASMPYGFPSGTRLIDEIITFLSQSHIQLLFQKYGEISKKFKPTSIKLFLKALVDAHPASIDDFLTFNFNNPDYQFIGKASILNCISRHEYPSKFLSRRVETVEFKGESIYREWYDILWKKMYEGSTTANSIINNKVTFITFNYDRSLEYFLKTSINGLYGLSNEDEIDNIMSNIPIYHIYGRIGELLKKSDPRFINYHADSIPLVGDILKDDNTSELLKTFDFINNLTSELYVYGEKAYDNKRFENTTNALNNTKFIYFFGFGFHQQNLEILFPAGLIKKADVKVFGTCKGINSRALLNSKSKICHIYNTTLGNIDFQDLTTLEYLNKYGFL